MQLLASIRVLDITQIMRRSICCMLHGGRANQGRAEVAALAPNFCSHGREDL